MYVCSSLLPPTLVSYNQKLDIYLRLWKILIFHEPNKPVLIDNITTLVSLYAEVIFAKKGIRTILLATFSKKTYLAEKSIRT